MAIQCTGKASYPLREGREFWALALGAQKSGVRSVKQRASL
ncbi:MAG: hypothetical protein ACP5I8_14395 [Phycisphaerae bacterium]